VAILDDEFGVTVLDPPYFDSDGAVLADTPAGNGLGRPEQIPRL
jgi:hypothetical protein